MAAALLYASFRGVRVVLNPLCVEFKSALMRQRLLVLNNKPFASRPLMCRISAATTATRCAARSGRRDRLRNGKLQCSLALYQELGVQMWLKCLEDLVSRKLQF